jgi:hypothetical protein
MSLFFYLTLLLVATAHSDGAALVGSVSFSLAACPPGWTELSLLQGRLLLAVNNSYQAGASVGFPLADGEDRVHQHIVSGFFNFDEKEVAALGGTDTSAAKKGQQPLLGFLNQTAPETSGFPFVQLTPCRWSGILNAPTYGAGSIILWDPAVTQPSGGCPASSLPLPAALSGRLMLLSNTTLSYNPAVPSLEPGKDVEHAHSFSASVNLDDLSFDGIAGCCDHDPAKEGQASMSGTSSSSSLGLPYVSVLLCNVTEDAPSNLPADLLLLTTLSSCPAGWVPLADSLSGRMVVGTPSFGIPSRTFGGAPFRNTSTAYPAHAGAAFELDFDSTPAGVALLSGSGSGGYGKQGHFHTVSQLDGSVVALQEQLPLLGVLACQHVR